MDIRVEPRAEQTACAHPKRTGCQRTRPWLLLVVGVVAAGIVWCQPWQSATTGEPPSRFVHAVAVRPAANGDIPIKLASLGKVTPLPTVTVSKPSHRERKDNQHGSG